MGQNLVTPDKFDVLRICTLVMAVVLPDTAAVIMSSSLLLLLLLLVLLLLCLQFQAVIKP